MFARIYLDSRRVTYQKSKCTRRTGVYILKTPYPPGGIGRCWLGEKIWEGEEKRGKCKRRKEERGKEKGRKEKEKEKMGS